MISTCPWNHKIMKLENVFFPSAPLTSTEHEKYKTKVKILKVILDNFIKSFFFSGKLTSKQNL